MPNGIPWISMSEILTLEEILTVAACGAELGIRHIKVTGGEPLVRKDCVYLVKMLKQIPGIEKVTITTNGVLLGQYLDELAAAGIDGINISLDTTDRKRYQEITGSDRLEDVMESLKRAALLSVPVKINAVSLDLGAGWEEVLKLAALYPVDVRFIEMMPIGYGKEFPAISHKVLFHEIEKRYPGLEKDDRVHGFGPAVYYKIPGFLGSVGLISAIHGKFCDSCNRVRLTSQGYLKTCLCYEDGVDLRKILRAGETKEETNRKLRQAMEEAVLRKPGAHCFEKPGQITENHGMSAIGG